MRWFRVAQMQLHVRGQARALDCVCSIISSRLHVRVKTHVYKVLRCKSCEAWHEFCHTVMQVIAVCANNKFQNCVFNPSQTRCQFNWETLSRFKRMKLYISNVPYSPVRFPLVISIEHARRKLRRLLIRDDVRLFKRYFDPWKFYRSCSRSFDCTCRIARGSCQVHRGTIIRGKDYFAYSHAARGAASSARSLSSRSLAGLKSGDGKVALSQAPIGPSRLQAQL